MGKLDITIGGRLALGFGTVLGFLVLALAVYIVGVQQEAQATSRLTQVVIPRLEAASGLETAYLYEFSGAQSYLDTGDERWLAEHQKGDSMAADAVSRLDQLPKSPDGAQLFDQMRALGSQLGDAADRAVALRRQGNTAEADQILDEEMYPTRDQLLQTADAFIALQSRLKDQTQAEVQQTQEASLRYSLAIALLALICSVVLAYYTARSVRRPVQRLVEASDRLSGGDYATATELAGGVAGEEGETARSEVRRLGARLAAAAEVLGLREGRLAAQSRLSSLLASSIDLGRLAEGALRELAGNTGAEVGVVYLYDDGHRLLQKVASYCLGDEVAEVVRPKEGMVGEAAASRRTMLVREIPADLPFTVRLGIDNLPPRWLAAVPLISSEELVGVVLLGGLKGPRKDDFEAVEDSARQLAISLQNALVHERVEAQNEELQAQSEEIQAQNEEIQAQNEELQAQSEELQSQNEELEAQANDLAEQNQRLAEQAEQIARLQGIALRMSESLSPKEVLDQVLKAANDLTGSSMASVFLLDEPKESFTVAAAVGLEEAQMDLRWLTREESLAGRVLAEGRTIPIEDISSHPNIRFPTLAGGKTLGSIMVAPMIAQGEALGVVEVYYDEPRSFADSDVELLSALGSAAAVAVHNSRLFDMTQRQRRLLESVLAGIPEAVVVADRLGRVVLSNAPAQQMFGVEVGTRLALGKDQKVFDNSEDTPDPARRGAAPSGLPQGLVVGEMVGAALAGRELLEREVRYLNRVSGAEGYAQVSAAPIVMQGRVVRAVLVAADISHLKEIEQSKDEFLSVVSHELKSPLTSVKGYAQLLTRAMASGASSERVERMAQTIVDQSDRVVAQVNRLLEMSRAQMGRLEVNPEPTDLAELVRGQLQAAQVKSSSHRLVEDLRGDLRGNWDPACLEQVIANLLENAVRYSPDGGEVRVVAEREQGVVRLKVSDQGIGIPAEMQELVFERHFRTDHAKRVRSDGLGIGLYLVRQIVAAHGGSVRVESEPGKGSTFTVELPIEAGRC